MGWRNFGLDIDNYNERDSGLDYSKTPLIFVGAVGLAGLVAGGTYGFYEGREIIQNIELLSQAPDFVKYSLNAASSLSVGVASGLFASGVAALIVLVGQGVSDN